MAGEGIDVEGPGDRGALDQMGDELVHPRILFMCPALGIILTFPKAQRKDLVGFRIRDKQNLVHEPLLVFEDRKDFIVNSFRELPRFSRFGLNGDDSCEHSVSSFRTGQRRTQPMLDRVKGQLPKNGARRKQAPMCENAKTVEHRN